MTSKEEHTLRPHLALAGQECRVVSAAGRLAVSELFSLDLCAVVEPGTAPESWIGVAAVLTISPPSGPAFCVHGIVMAAEQWTQRVADSSTTYLKATVKPAVAPLTIGRDHRYFQEMDTVEIVKDVLKRNSIADEDVVWRVSSELRKREYTAQAGESDWALVERLLADDGLTYWFELAEDHTRLVVSDNTPDADPLPGGPIPVRAESSLQGDVHAAYALTVSWRATPAMISLRDYAPKTPSLSLDASAGSGDWECYDYPGRFDVPKVGTSLSARRLDAARSRRKVLWGRLSGPCVYPGYVIQLEETALPAKWLAVQLVFSCDFTEGQGGGKVDFRFEAVPSDTAFRPPVVEPWRVLRGPQTAVVVAPPGKELHTDDVGRVRAQPYWDRVGEADDKSSTFMRVGQFALGNSMVRPRAGWDVLVGHGVGDADAVEIMTHLYDGANPPPYALPANKTRTAWQTGTTPGGGSSNEIRFEDKAGAEEIFINASKDMNVIVGDTKTKKIGANHTHEIGAASKIKVGSDRNLAVIADQSVTVGAAETLTVSGSRSTNVGGAETITVGAARTVTSTSGKNLDADGGRSHVVGANMMGLSALGVNRMVLGSASITVGGAWITAAATGLANVTVGAGAETIGGVKLQLGAGGVAVSVKGAFAETVGAAYVSAAGGNFGETASGALSVTVGGAFLANAPSIEVEADSEIKIVCGATSVTITSSSIEIRSPAVPAPGPNVAKEGGKVQHN